MEKPRILVVGQVEDAVRPLVDQVADRYEIVVAASLLRAVAHLTRDQFAGVYLAADHLHQAFDIGKLLQNEQVLEGMPDGVVLIDSENTILWSNGRMRAWSGQDSLVGANFYAVLGSPEILGPDYCPFHTALATHHATNSTLRTPDARFYHVHAVPLSEVGQPARHLVVTVRETTREVLQQQKLAAIHQAGLELADLRPNELFDMSVEERIDLLKANILQFTRELLHFAVVEVRLLDPATGKLEPLLSEGLEPGAASRTLYARAQDNGVTGFVAATGMSYLCEDTAEDPLYLEGARAARSSITVPIVWRDAVIGTFNVESPEPRAFGESDLQFLEIFCRDVAMALNTLELLVAEKACTAAESVEAIHSAVAIPVDQILNDAVAVMERYIGHEPEVVERLHSILHNARDIKQVIQQVGQRMTPSQAHPAALAGDQRPALRDRIVLVADADENVRGAAHSLLERYGCLVETARDGQQTISMVRAMLHVRAYDAVIADIRLPDMSGYDLMVRLKELTDPLPLILMTGFGYDPGHSLVKARQAGLQAVLYKPFRLDQLLQNLERVMAGAESMV